MRFRRINTDLLYLFASNLAILFVGMGLFPVLPLYAADLGAGPGLVGLYLALTYLSITLGTLAFGWLALRFPHRVILAAVGLLGIPALVLMGWVTALWQLVILTGIVWFTGGVGLSMVSVLTGLITNRQGRGQMFSLMALSMPLGALAGGMVVSQLIAWQGYRGMLATLGGSWIVIPLAAWRLDNCSLADRTKSASRQGSGQGRIGATFYFFVLAFLLATIAINVGRLGTSLSMKGLAFSPSQVASTATISGLLALPVVLVIGPISDRIQRRHILALNYLLVAGGVVALVVATQLWHFWLAATLLLIARCVNGAIGAAFATDMLAPGELVRGLSWLNTTNWAGGVVTFAGSGFLLNQFGSTPVYLAAGMFALLAATRLEWSHLRPGQTVLNMVEETKRITQTQLPVMSADCGGTQ
jgi:MFS family permease